MGLNHEDLGRKINEKISVLKKLEGGKMTPNNTLARKLEHALRIKLLVPLSRENIQKMPSTSTIRTPVTLGDFLKTKDEPSEDAT